MNHATHDDATSSSGKKSGGAYERVTPLRIAAQHAHLDVVRVLVKHKGIDLDKPGKTNEEDGFMSPLQVARHCGYDEIVEVIEDALQASLDAHVSEEDHPEDWNVDAMAQDLRNTFLQSPIHPDENLPSTNRDELASIIRDAVRAAYKRREDLIGSERLRAIERMVYLSVIDEKWKEHLREMDDLKEGIGLRGYGQKDPLVEYKREGFQMFVELLDEINRETVKTLFRIRIDESPAQRPDRAPQRLALVHQDAAGMGFAPPPEPSPMEQTAANSSEGGGRPKQRPVKVEKVGRNAPCPCGSGKKYKHCHGA